MEHTAFSSAEATTRRTICRLCAGLCGLILSVEDNRIVKIAGDKSHPVSRGYTCPKGRALGAWHHHPHRLNEPRIRRSGTEQVTVTWQECLDDLGDRIGELIETHGPGAVGIYIGTAGLFDGTAQIWRSLFAAIGSPSVYSTISVDAATTLLVQDRVSGNPLLAGQPDPDAKMVILIGMNPMVSHGQNFGMTAPKIQLRQWAREGRLWVVDPRRTETAEVANHHLRPRLGSEYAILGHLTREILRDGADREFLARFTTGVDAIEALVARFDLATTCRLTGLKPAVFESLLRDIRATGRLGIMTGTGVSMSRTANLTLLMQYALLAVTGSLDRPGGEWYNPGFVRNADATGWPHCSYDGPGAPSRPDIPSRMGEYSAGVLVDEIEAGNLRALIILGGNPTIALPETERLRRALDSLDVLAVADVIETETVGRATHVLPSCGQLERADLPYIDFLSPRQFVQYTPAIVTPPEGRKPLWWMITQLGLRLGHDLLGGASPDSLTDDDMLRPLAGNAKASFDEIKAAPQGLEIQERPWGWVDRHLPRGRWNLAPSDIVAQFDTLEPPAERPDHFLLIPARQRHKLNSVMSDGTAALRKPDCPALGINPEDAARLSLNDGAEAIVRGGNGAVCAITSIEERVLPGTVSFPHGFEHQSVGNLTMAADIDPLSGMVVLSGIPVTVEAAA